MPYEYVHRAFYEGKSWVNMLKAIIFDLDGILIDSEPIAYSILQEMVSVYGGSIPLEDYTANYLGRTVAMGMATIKSIFNAPESEEELMEIYLRKEKEKLAEGVPLKPGVKELLVYIKNCGYKTIVASSSVRERAESILKSYDILKYFDDMVFGYEVPKGKPNPDIFLKACEKLGVQPHEAIVIEDSEAGIEAAYSANITTICIPDMKHPDKHYRNMVCYMFESLFDVMRLLEEYGQM